MYLFSYTYFFSFHGLPEQMCDNVSFSCFF